jgi:aminoglycoside phosphotransferase (APT) family kinase protein
LEHWEFYMALAYFKLAIIAAGIQFRDRMGGGSEYGDKVGEAVAPLIAAGLAELAAT